MTVLFHYKILLLQYYFYQFQINNNIFLYQNILILQSYSILLSSYYAISNMFYYFIILLLNSVASSIFIPAAFQLETLNETKMVESVGCFWVLLQQRRTSKLHFISSLRLFLKSQSMFFLNYQPSAGISAAKVYANNEYFSFYSSIKSKNVR